MVVIAMIWPEREYVVEDEETPTQASCQGNQSLTVFLFYSPVLLPLPLGKHVQYISEATEGSG